MRPTEPAALSDGDTLAGPGGGVHHDLAPPARIGRYLVLHELGRGGMGVVLLAHDPELDRKVAVELLGAQGADAAQQDRLLREARAMARLAHPNVAAVFDVGERPRGDRVFGLKSRWTSPAAEGSSRFTLLVINWLMEAPVAAVARRVRA